MRQLLLMRHAKSGYPPDVAADFDRPLSRRGREDGPRMGRLLAAHGPRPDLVVCSPAQRALETAQAVVDELGGPRVPVRCEPELYLAAVATLEAVASRLPPSVATCLVVGHNPALEHLVATLAGALVRLPTGATLLLRPGTELDPLERWSDLGPGTCTLEWLVTPRLLRRLR